MKLHFFETLPKVSAHTFFKNVFKDTKSFYSVIHRNLLFKAYSADQVETNLQISIVPDGID